jgi:hypothetical protein
MRKDDRTLGNGYSGPQHRHELGGESMRRSLAVVAAVGVVIGLGVPAWGDTGSSGGEQRRYHHHDRYKGNYYDYPDYRGDPYSDYGPYDGYYDCRRSEGPRHSETWCDHYYGWDK